MFHSSQICKRSPAPAHPSELGNDQHSTSVSKYCSGTEEKYPIHTSFEIRLGTLRSGSDSSLCTCASVFKVSTGAMKYAILALVE